MAHNGGQIKRSDDKRVTGMKIGYPEGPKVALRASRRRRVIAGCGTYCGNFDNSSPE